MYIFIASIDIFILNICVFLHIQIDALLVIIPSPRLALFGDVHGSLRGLERQGYSEIPEKYSDMNTCIYIYIYIHILYNMYMYIYFNGHFRILTFPFPYAPYGYLGHWQMNITDMDIDLYMENNHQ